MAEPVVIRTYNPYKTMRGGFMPNCLMECGSISQAAKVCYLALASFAGKDKETCWPSQTTLATRYGSNERSTREHLDELITNGFITVRQNGLRQSNTYTFLSLEDWEENEIPDRQNLPVLNGGKSPVCAAENRRSRTAENRRSFPYEPLSYEPLSYEPPEIPEDAVHNSPPIASLESQNQPQLPPAEGTPEPVPETQYGGDFADESTLQLDEPIGVFVKNAYTQSRGSKVSKAELKSLDYKLNNLEDSHGPEEFRTALWSYLGSSSDWLRTNKWPLAAFLKDVDRYVPGQPRAYSASLTVVPPVGTFTGLAVVPAPVTDYPAIWDAELPQRPVGTLMLRTRRKLDAAAKDSDFAGNFRTICAKCARLIAAGEPTTFQWLFTGKDEQPNWAGLLEGKFDFLMKKKNQGGIDWDEVERLAEIERGESE